MGVIWIQFTFLTLTNADFLLLQKHNTSIAEKQKRHRSILMRIKNSPITLPLKKDHCKYLSRPFLHVYLHLSSVDMI